MKIERELWSNSAAAPGAKNDPDYRYHAQISRARLEVFVPDAPKSQGAWPVVICVPGGGYEFVSAMNEGDELVAPLHTAGFAGAVLYYRLPSPRVMERPEEGPLDDLRQALNLVRSRAAEWKLDPARVGVLGFSAGGHLAASALTLLGSDRPAFGGLIYPVISMKPGITHDGSRDKLLGNTPSSARLDRFSLDLQVTRETPPTFLAHSADDTAVPVANSLLFYGAMVKHGARGELHVYERGGHGYGVRGMGTEGGWIAAFTTWAQGVCHAE